MSATGTMSDRGNAYVAAWPASIAAKTRLSAEHVAEALVRSGLAASDQQSDLRMKFLHGEATPQIAALTPDTAHQVIAELRAISDEINKAARTHCHYCGLSLKANGECHSCGTSL